MRYVIQNGKGYGTRYAAEPLQIGEHELMKIPENLIPLIEEAESMYRRDVKDPKETRAYRLRLPDGHGVVINVQSMRGNNQLHRRSCC